MTAQDVTTKLTEPRDSKAWNYILICTAILTLVVAARNISIYTDELLSMDEDQ
jgi:hypothetical protein